MRNKPVTGQGQRPDSQFKHGQKHIAKTNKNKEALFALDDTCHMPKTVAHIERGNDVTITITVLVWL